MNSTRRSTDTMAKRLTLSGFALLIAALIAPPPTARGADKTGKAGAQQTINAQAPNAGQPKTEQQQIQALLGGTGVGLSREVGPPPEVIEPVKDKLDKMIKVQFLDTPLERVIGFLQRESGVTMLVNRVATNGLEKEPVSLEAEQMSIKDALDWACLTTRTDWDVVKGVIIVSTPSAIKKRHVTTKVYDIRALLVNVPNFINVPEFDVNSALSNTSSGGSSGGAAQASTQLFGEADDVDMPTREEAIEGLTTLIQDTVGAQEEWAAYGGDISSLRELNGNLIVRTTPRNHDRIAALLRALHESKARMVNLEARFVQVPSKFLDETVRKNNGQQILDAKATDELLAALGGDDLEVTVHGVMRTVCNNSQRVHMIAGRQSAFVSDIEPVSGGNGVDPTLSVQLAGNMMDVQPTIGFDGKTVMLTFRSDLVTGHETTATDLPVIASEKSISIEAGKATTPAGADDADQPAPDLAIQGKLASPSKLAGSARIEKPQVDVIRYRSSVTVPDGGAVILTGVSRMIQSVNIDKGELVLILRARAQQRGEQPAQPAQE